MAPLGSTCCAIRLLRGLLHNDCKRPSRQAAMHLKFWMLGALKHHK